MQTYDNNSLIPPWIKYPRYGPADGFWRQSGESWLKDIWEPFFRSLTDDQQNEYLTAWNVPDEWRRYYFDADFQRWLDHVDDD
jgi:hypothetical protein